MHARPWEGFPALPSTFSHALLLALLLPLILCCSWFRFLPVFSGRSAFLRACFVGATLVSCLSWFFADPSSRFFARPSPLSSHILRPRIFGVTDVCFNRADGSAVAVRITTSGASSSSSSFLVAPSSGFLARRSPLFLYILRPRIFEVTGVCFGRAGGLEEDVTFLILWAARASSASFCSFSFVAAAASFSSFLPTVTADFWSVGRSLLPRGRCSGRGRGCARARSGPPSPSSSFPRPSSRVLASSSFASLLPTVTAAFGGARRRSRLLGSGAVGAVVVGRGGAGVV